jgi:hypothetical protein
MDIKIKTSLITLEITDCTNYSTVIKEVVNEAIRLHEVVAKEYSTKNQNNED